MRRFRFIAYFLTFLEAGLLMPARAGAHMVNAEMSGFYAGMLHPLTSAEHLLPMMALALLAAQYGRQAGRLTVWLFPLALFMGTLAGSRFAFPEFFHLANLAALMVLGLLIVTSRAGRPALAAGAAVVTGLILGWRSGGDWAVSEAGFPFVPGVALTGFIVAALITAWMPSTAAPGGRLLRRLAGGGFLIAGLLLSVLLLRTGEAVSLRGIGLPTEANLRALVSAPHVSLSFVVGALLAAMLWGAAHALTPGHGKAIVAAYLVGSRGTPWHALYLGLTVTVTHTLAVFGMGLAALLASKNSDPETLNAWLAFISGLIVFALGAVMFAQRVRRCMPDGHGAAGPQGHTHPHAHDHDDHGHHHVHDHHHAAAPHAHEHPRPHAALPTDRVHGHDPSHHHVHHGHSHSHMPPGANGAPVTWRALLTLGIGAGLLPCPAAMVLLLSAIAMQRLVFGLALVAAFSVGLAGVLSVVGLLFIRGSRLVDHSPWFALAGRWLPATGALAICLLGGGITWRSVSKLFG